MTPNTQDTVRCNQCWKHFPPDVLGGKSNCPPCRARLNARGGYRPLGRSPDLGGRRLRVHFERRSQVHKLGGIPSSTTSGATCPTSCALRGAGCYAEFGHGGAAWRALSRGEAGMSWGAFLGEIAFLPEGTLWRHNLAGDLPGTGDRLDVERLSQLVAASAGTRGFTFTHKPLKRPIERAAVLVANAAGFAINLSAHGLRDADAKLALGIAPVTTVLPSDAPKVSYTPSGRRVIVCPSQQDPRQTCASCGLCAVTDRADVVGFRAHGQMMRKVSLSVIR